MHNPFKIAASEFLQREPLVLLVAGVATSLMAAVALFLAAKSESVIPGGIGLLENYGLIAGLTGSAVFPYLARTYCDQVREIGCSGTTICGATIQKEMLALDSMLKLKNKSIYILYMLVLVGSMFWISNVSFHLLGYSSIHWGNVFDSLHHIRSFSANRLFNIYSWVLLIPFCGYVVLLSSIQMVRAISKASEDGSIKYDLLNPDRYGGFAPVWRTHVTFNMLFAITYLQVVLYNTTFDTMNIEHLVAYIGLTVFFLFGNSIIMAKANRQIKKLTSQAETPAIVVRLSDELNPDQIRLRKGRAVHKRGLGHFLGRGPGGRGVNLRATAPSTPISVPSSHYGYPNLDSTGWWILACFVP